MEFKKLKKEISKFFISETGAITKKSIIASGLVLAALSAVKDTNGANCFWHDSERGDFPGESSFTFGVVPTTPSGWDAIGVVCDTHCNILDHLSHGGEYDCNENHFSGHKSGADWAHAGQEHYNTLNLKEIGTTIIATHTHQMHAARCSINNCHVSDHCSNSGGEHCSNHISGLSYS